MLLNGAPGVGKSTIAARYVAAHPPALAVEVDHVRRLLPDWQARPEESGLEARRLAIVTIRTLLADGVEVVVPQYLGRAGFIAELEAVAAETGAAFAEVVLMADRATVVGRFAARTAAAADPSHLEAQQLVGLEGAESVAGMYDRLVALVGSRPGAVLVDTRCRSVDDTYAAFVSAMSRHPPPDPRRDGRLGRCDG